MTAREKVLAFLEERGAEIVFWSAAALFLSLRLSLFFRYGLSQDEVLIISQIKTWDPVKIWHYYGFRGQGFFLQHYIFYVLSLCGVFASVTYLRFICLVESFLGFFLLFKFTKKYFGALVCFGALLVYAVSPYQIIYTLYIRFYALVMTLVIAECYFYFEALEKEDWKKLWLPALFAALAYCTHQFSVFIQPVFLLHFLIFCLARRPNKANAKWFVWGALTLAFIAGLALCAPALAKKTGLIFGARDAWLPVKLGLASQRLQFFFWNDALPLRVCSLVFLWLSLGLAITARIAKREKMLPEIFLVLGIVIPYFFLSHFHFAHFFDKRYLAFWFPIWTVAWVVWLEFPAYVLGNLRVLEGKTVLRNVSAGVFFLVFLISFFRFSSLFKMRWIEIGNREAVTFLEERAANKDLPLILISEPDAGSRNNILPQYYFDVLDHKGEACLDLMTVMRKGAAYEKMDESAVVWSQTAKRLKKPEAFERSQIGSHELIYGGTFTNWHDVAEATAKVIPESAKLMPSGPLYYEGVLDVGSKEADAHLLSGFSHDEFVSPEENWTWCVGTNITARFMFMGCTNYCVAARVRAIEKMRADFFLDGQPVGSASIGTAFTNVLFRANVIPKPRPNGAPLLLSVITSGTKVPGQVAKGVYDNRPLSLCFDKLTVCPAPDEEEPAAAIGLADHRPKAREAKAGEPFEITVLCANLGKTTWKCQGNDPTRLSLSWQHFDHKEIQDDRIWLPRDVPPGDTVRVKCSVKAPERSCSVLLLDMVHENVRFFRQGLLLSVQIVE